MTQIKIYQDNVDVKGDALAALHIQLHNIRVKHMRQGYYPKSNNIPSAFELKFAQFDDALGCKNKVTRRYKSIKESFLSDVKKAWAEYYSSIAHNQINYSKVRDALHEYYQVSISLMYYRSATRVYKEIKSGRTLKFGRHMDKPTREELLKRVEMNDINGFVSYCVKHKLSPQTCEIY